MKQPQSLFTTTTFKGATITLVAGILTIALDCGYDKRYPTKPESLTLLTLFTAYSWTLVGRVQNSSVYTPHGLPGSDKEDFYLPDYLEKVKK